MPTSEQVGRIVKRTGEVLTIREDESIRSAAEMMTMNEVGCLIVVDCHGCAVGIISERDIISKVVARSSSPDGTPVSKAMNTPVIACTISSPVNRAQQLMVRHGIRHLPVVENGSPVGMLSGRDILAHELVRARAVARRQGEVLEKLEGQYPGITDLQKDETGRIVI